MLHLSPGKALLTVWVWHQLILMSLSDYRTDTNALLMCARHPSLFNQSSVLQPSALAACTGLCRRLSAMLTDSTLSQSQMVSQGARLRHQSRGRRLSSAAQSAFYAHQRTCRTLRSRSVPSALSFLIQA